MYVTHMESLIVLGQFYFLFHQFKGIFLRYNSLPSLKRAPLLVIENCQHGIHYSTHEFRSLKYLRISACGKRETIKQMCTFEN